MNVLSYVAPSFGERAMDALVMVVKGMVMVFLVLTVLMFALKLMECFFVRKKAEKPIAPQAGAVVAEPEPVVQNDDGALVAAITAAISVVLASEGGEQSAGGFRVVSFKRVGAKNAWNAK